jgi:N-acetylmuramoyl-L-alanine amidase
LQPVVLLAVAGLGLCLAPVPPARSQPAEVRQVAPGVSEVRKGAPPAAAPVPSRDEPTLAQLAPGGAAAGPNRLLVVQMPSSPDIMGLQLVLARPGRVTAFTTPDPARLVIDFEAADVAPGALEGLVLPPWASDYRYGLIGGGRLRLLFDLTLRARLVRLAPEATDARRLRLELNPVRGGEGFDAAASVTFEPHLPAGLEPPAPVRRPLGRPVVVVDPGHGGIDPGAVSDAGLLEKEIVLAVALELRRALAAGGRFDVRLTREGDQFVRLGDRVRFAQAAGAELFISIHADTFAGQPGAGAVRGGSIYVLGEEASRGAAELAARENAADAVAGEADTSAIDRQVGPILAELAARETLDLSQRLQGLLVRDLRRAMTLAREPARTAGFRVLRQAEVPSVLIELGYMSSAADIALLQSSDWQRSVAQAITRAVDAYFAGLPTARTPSRPTSDDRGRSATP